MQSPHTRLLAAGLALLAACATPQPVSRLSPVHSGGTWDQGAEVIHFEQGGLAADVAFVRSTGAYLVFDVLFRNRSGEAILLAPERFFAEPLGADTSTLAAAALPAIDPEQVLLRLDVQESRAIADAANDALLQAIDAGAEIARDLSSKENREERRQRDAEWRDRQEQYYQEDIQREMAFRSLDEERAYWANNAIRKTTLANGYEMRGLVFFPRNNQARFIRVVLPVDGPREFALTYRQHLHRTAP